MSFVRPLETGWVLNKMHIEWNISFKMPYFKVPDFLHYWRNRKYVPRNITEHYCSEDNGFSKDVFVLNIFSLTDFRCEFSKILHKHQADFGYGSSGIDPFYMLVSDVRRVHCCL